MKKVNKTPFILPQMRLLNELISIFSNDRRVDQIIVRGSFAKKTYDELSDVDLLLVIDDSHFNEMLTGIDFIVSENLSSINKKGWVDSFVADFGGLGLIYLLNFDDAIIQLDLYLTSSSCSKKIYNFIEKEVRYTRPGYIPRFSNSKSTKQSVENYVANADDKYQIVLTFPVIMFMLLKHISRGNSLLTLKYSYSALESIARIIRILHTPERVGRVLYDWHEDFRDSVDLNIQKFEEITAETNTSNHKKVCIMIDLYKSIVTSEDLYKDFPELSDLISVLEYNSMEMQAGVRG